MITNKETMAQVFSNLHDGTLYLDMTPTEAYHCWKVDCEYLAERIQPQYTLFWIKVYGLKKFVFHPWLRDLEAPEIVLTAPTALSQIALGIYEATVKEGEVTLVLEDSYEAANFAGGTLVIACQGIELLDQAWKPIEAVALGKLANAYWAGIRDA